MLSEPQKIPGHSVPHQPFTQNLTPPEALLLISVLAVAADGKLSDVEQETLEIHYHRFTGEASPPAFREHLNHLCQITTQYAYEDILETAKKILSPRLRETAFAIAVDVVLADGVFTTDEKQFITELWNALAIPDEIGQKIIDVMVIKNCRSQAENIFAQGS